MKHLKHIVICIFGIIVLLGVLVETGTLKFSFYKNEVSCNINSNGNNLKSIDLFKESTKEVSFDSIPVRWNDINFKDFNS